MTAIEFQRKHELTPMDIKNLFRYETVRESGEYNMHEYLAFMRKNNTNGGAKLADWITYGDNYNDYLRMIKKAEEVGQNGFENINK